MAHRLRPGARPGQTRGGPGRISQGEARSLGCPGSELHPPAHAQGAERGHPTDLPQQRNAAAPPQSAQHREAHRAGLSRGFGDVFPQNARRPRAGRPGYRADQPRHHAGIPGARLCQVSAAGSAAGAAAAGQSRRGRDGRHRQQRHAGSHHHGCAKRPGRDYRRPPATRCSSSPRTCAPAGPGRRPGCCCPTASRFSARRPRGPTARFSNRSRSWPRPATFACWPWPTCTWPRT